MIGDALRLVGSAQTNRDMEAELTRIAGRALGTRPPAPSRDGTGQLVYPWDEALARVARDDGLACQAIPEFLDETNVRSIVREGDVVLLAVDNHRARALVDRHLGSLDDATLISGGNDETDGNVQLVRRRDGWSMDGHLTEIHPEIGLAAQSDVMPGTGCAALAAERPQLVVTNLMVASAMLNCLWAVTEQGSVPSSEVYLDVVHNAARSRSWFRVPAGAQ